MVIVGLAPLSSNPVIGFPLTFSFKKKRSSPGFSPNTISSAIKFDSKGSCLNKRFIFFFLFLFLFLTVFLLTTPWPLMSLTPESSGITVQLSASGLFCCLTGGDESSVLSFIAGCFLGSRENPQRATH